MDDETFQKMRESFRESMRRFPNCRIANCICDSNNDEWKKDCHCICHFFLMDKKFGKDKWNLNDFFEMAKKGIGSKSKS